MAKESPPPYTPKSPVYCDVNGEPKIDQPKIDIEPKLEKNKIDGWGNKSPDGEKSRWLHVSNAAKSGEGSGWNTTNKPKYLLMALVPP